jgi:hypothetical protein
MNNPGSLAGSLPTGLSSLPAAAKNSAAAPEN